MFVVLLLAVVSVEAAVCPTDPFEKHLIKANGIEVYTIPFGATLTNLFVQDDRGELTDVVLGYDDTKDWYTDPRHPYFGPVVGRYANRIANATFEIDGLLYHTPLNEKNWDTLHGGWTGFDRLNWTITEQSENSITYLAFSSDGDQGFPGNVHVWVTYTVDDRPSWDIRFKAITDKPTPVMLSNHIYWNLGAFRVTDTVLFDEVQIKSSKFIAIDEYEIPTGALPSVAVAPFLNFTHPKTIGKDIQVADMCGKGCIGYDNAFIFDKPGYGPAQASLHSPYTGISWDLITDQVALQMYSCNFQDGTERVKEDNNAKFKFVPKYGCVVFEPESYIDSINQNWDKAPNAILRPGQEYEQHTTYLFTTKRRE